MSEDLGLHEAQNEFTPQARRALMSREEVISELKKDFLFGVFYLTPSLSQGSRDWRDWGRRLGLSDERAESYRERLLQVGLWREEGGRARVVETAMDLGDLSMAEMMTMSLNVLSRVSETGPCFYESLFVVTNEQLKKDFYRQINKAVRDFVEKSAEAAPETVVAWNHSALDCLKLFPEERMPS